MTGLRVAHDRTGEWVVANNRGLTVVSGFFTKSEADAWINDPPPRWTSGRRRKPKVKE